MVGTGRFEDLDGPKSTTTEPHISATLEAARTYFEPQLESIGLSAEQIEGQTLEELEVSLTNVNAAIQRPESFGSLQLSFPARGAVKFWVVEAGAPEGQISIGAFPVLLT
jgi:hypothetical protein